MFKVLHSSAGAGKTHALVKHYLLLSLHGPDPAAYSHILALTFTNKAAAEMRERVLVYLEALASEKPMDGAKADVREPLRCWRSSPASLRGTADGTTYSARGPVSESSSGAPGETRTIVGVIPARRVSTWTSERCASVCTVTTTPEAPARAVRPERCR